MSAAPISEELPVTGWALAYLAGRKLPPGARLLAMYFAGWAYGLMGQWPPDQLPSPQVIALELRCSERTARKYLQMLEDNGFLAQLNERRGLS